MVFGHYITLFYPLKIYIARFHNKITGFIYLMSIDYLIDPLLIYSLFGQYFMILVKVGYVIRVNTTQSF